MPGPETGVRASFVIVRDPGAQDHPLMSLIPWDHEIQALAPQGSHRPFANSHVPNNACLRGTDLFNSDQFFIFFQREIKTAPCPEWQGVSQE